MSNFPLARKKGKGPFMGVFEDFDDLFEFPQFKRSQLADLSIPPLEVKENDEQFSLQLELPGMKSEDITVDLSEDSILSVSGEKTREETTDGDKIHRSERYYGKVERSIQLPCKVDAEKVDARYTDGILYLNLPKLSKTGSRRIEIG